MVTILTKGSSPCLEREYQVKDLYERFGTYLGVAEFLNGLIVMEVAYPQVSSMIQGDNASGSFDDQGDPLVWDGDFQVRTRYHDSKAIEVLVFVGNDGPGGPESGNAMRYIWDDDIILLVRI